MTGDVGDRETDTVVADGADGLTANVADTVAAAVAADGAETATSYLADSGLKREPDDRVGIDGAFDEAVIVGPVDEAEVAEETTGPDDAETPKLLEMGGAPDVPDPKQQWLAAVKQLLLYMILGAAAVATGISIGYKLSQSTALLDQPLFR